MYYFLEPLKYKMGHWMNESKYICGVNISIMLQIRLMVKALAQLPRKNTLKNTYLTNLMYGFVLFL